MQVETDKEWTQVIRPKRTWYDINLSEVWKYRDLVMIFVRRDFVAMYKQTVLGPLWYLIQPLLTTLVFTVIFGRIAKLSTAELPAIIFYMSGITGWNYFSTCLNKTSGTFISNASVFGKVYFPRLTVPISVVISNLITFGIQFLFLMCFWLYFYFRGDLSGINFSGEDYIGMNLYILLIPVLLFMMALMGIGFGLIISSFTVKYKDLQFLVGFGVQLFMYATPIIYPLRDIPLVYRRLIMLNPMTSVIETFKFTLFNFGTFSWTMLAYSFVFSILIFAVGIVLFNKVEQKFIDTI